MGEIYVNPDWDKYVIRDPGCCEEAKKTGVLYLIADPCELEMNQNTPVKWQVQKRTYGTGMPANFCPFCGKPTPSVRKKEDYDPSEIANIDDGGYYCNNCGERANQCSCKPVESLWEIDR